MSNSNFLIYPNLDLFTYYLANGLGQDDKEVYSNYQSFCRLFGNLECLKNFDDIESENSDYIELLDGEKGYQPLPDNLDGFYYPVKLGDSYALQINCAGKWGEPEQRYIPQTINALATIKNNILDHLQDNNDQGNAIGQTWFVWGQLTTDDQNAQAIAEEIYQQLSLFAPLDWQKDLKTDLQLTEAKLLGADCFELWQLPSDRGTIEQNKHLLICLFPSHLSIKSIGQNIQKIYPRLMRLFLSRNKIILAYQQSRDYKKILKNSAKEVQSIVKALPDKINNSIDPSVDVNLGLLQRELAHTLNLMSGYAETLSYLEEQKNTIEANFKNYQRLVTDLNLPCLQAFTPIVSEKYLPQISSDLTSLSSGLRLLENSVRTIEGIINIEQAKGDRALNETIFKASQEQAEDALKLNQTFIAATAGLATSQVVSTLVIAYYPAKDKDGNSVSNPIFYLGSIFILSLVCGSLVFWLVRKILTSKVKLNLA
jgi:hypothetical protein